MSNIDTKSRTKIQDSELHLGVASGTLGGIGKGKFSQRWQHS